MKQGQKLSIKTKAKVVIRSENLRVSKCSVVRSAIMIRGAVQKKGMSLFTKLIQKQRD